MLKITLEQLEKLDACLEGIEWFRDKYPAEEADILDLRARLEAEDKEEWFNWLLAHLLNRENKTKYAIYAAELVLHIYENKYPDDDRPRKAIEAAKNCLESDTAKAAARAEAAKAWDAMDAAVTTRDAGDTVWATGAAARAAGSAAYSAVWAADTAYSAAAEAAANAVLAATRANGKEMYKKIFDFGVELLKTQEK